MEFYKVINKENCYCLEEEAEQDGALLDNALLSNLDMWHWLKRSVWQRENC